VRGALRSIVAVCLGMLAVVACVTVFLVWAFGHPVAWSVIGFLFAAVPLTGLCLAVGVGLRAAVAAGPRWVGVRILGRWRVVDLGEVRVVRLAEDGPFRGFGFGAPGGLRPFGGPGGLGGPGLGSGGPGGRGPASGDPAGPAGRGGGGVLVLEDEHGGRVDIGLDALGSGLAEVVRRGLGPDVDIDEAAARVLDEP
jgi:hypothetical protein